MRLRERRPVPGGPYALATTDDGIVRTSLVQAGALHRSDSGTLVEFGTGSRPMLVVGEGRPHAVLPDGHRHGLGLTPGDEPHGLCRDRDGNVRVALEPGFVAVVAPHGGACGLRVRTGRG